ncbi:MAG: GNAT family N-acetyltransferase [Clostridia bacterium]|nr:GNAT family N-acetyltransferase [Clostridia bacterium]
MEIRFSEEKDIKELKNIWKICFRDEDAYIDLFLAKLYKPHNTIVATEDGKVVGCLYMIPASFAQKSFMYGYAIGVLPEYRGRSICEKMLYFVKKLSKENGFLFGLHPANEKLFEFYKRIGLKEMYSLKIVDASSFESQEKCEIKDITPKEYFSLREKRFENFISWSEDLIRYMFSESKLSGRFFKKVIFCGKEKIISGRISDETVYISETTMTDEEIKSAAPYLKDFFKGEKIVFHLPCASKLGGKIRTEILGFGGENETYMSLFLD